MVIDDSFVERKIVSKAIKKRFDDLQIFEEENGLNICGKLISNNIHVCVLDIMMPEKDGFEILEEIKHDVKMIDIPIIVCTGLSDRQVIEKALSLGAYDYFSKPLSEEELKISLPMKVKNAIDFMKRKEETIFLSYHDKLTGLYNRRYSEDEMFRLDVKENLPISLIMGDVNGLKLTNDAFGHEAGDYLLKRIADIIKESCRANETVSRVGGDEFLILLPKTDRQKAEETIEKIKRQCDLEEEDPVKPSISFGYAVKEVMDQDIMDTYKDAEDRMYNSKLVESKTIKSSILASLVKNLNRRAENEEVHAKRLSQMCDLLGKELELKEEQIQKLKLLSVFHNIGMTVFPAGMDESCYEITLNGNSVPKTHCEIGYRIANSIPDITPIARDILSHHEKWNGTGYPQGLKGEEIPYNARIISVLDYYDGALHGTNPIGKKDAINFLVANAGIYFDPSVVDAFLKVI